MISSWYGQRGEEKLLEFLKNINNFHDTIKFTFDWSRDCIKHGAYYCYCAYVLRISRYSDFLSPMLTNTGIFLRGLKLSGESRS